MRTSSKIKVSLVIYAVLALAAIAAAFADGPYNGRHVGESFGAGHINRHAKQK